MLSFRFRVAACYSSSYKDPVDRGPNKFSNGRIFLPVQPVNTTVPILFTRVRTDFCQYQQWIFFLSKPPGFYRANCAMHSSVGYWSPRTSGTVPVKILTWWGQKKLAHFAVQKVAKLRASCENERRIGASFCPFKNVSGPVKRGSFTLNGTLQMMPFLTLWTRARSRFAVLKLSFVLLPIMLFFPSWFAPKTQAKRTHCLRVLPRQ